MKLLFTQHWTGELTELCKLSMDASRKYAEYCGAQYMFLEGNVFNPNLHPYLQKIFILDKSLDEYDIVVMIDMDMFPRKGLKENIFEATGYGVCDEGNKRNAYARLKQRYPQYSSKKHPFWGGSVYRFPRDIRIKLRSQFDKIDKEWDLFNGNFADEGIMHRCAMLANIPMKDAHLSDYWSMGHFRKGLEKAGFIHVRGGFRNSNGRKSAFRPKIENYTELKEKGFV